MGVISLISFRCKTCGKEREVKSFSPHKGCKSGYDTSRCKPCKKSRNDWKKVPPEKRMFNRAKTRAKLRGQDFNIGLEDIAIPDVCPVFSKPLIYGDTDWTPSLDRIDPTKGYIKGNIMIISNKANRCKSNLTLNELEELVEYVRACEIVDLT